MEKCEVMYFGRRNGGIDYFLNGKMLRKSETQRDLGAIVQDSLKVNVQVQSAVRKANAMLAFMSRGLEYKSRDVLTLERVQRRFTRMIPGMKSLSYEERLRTLGLWRLEG